jgi:hypothetical protein
MPGPRSVALTPRLDRPVGLSVLLVNFFDLDQHRSILPTALGFLATVPAVISAATGL